MTCLNQICQFCDNYHTLLAEWWETVPFDITELPQDLQISVGWTAAAGAADSEIAALAADVPLFSYSAVGFLDEELDPSLRGSGLPRSV